MSHTQRRFAMALWVDKVDLSIDIISVMSDKDLSIDLGPWMPFITIKVYQSVSNRWSVYHSVSPGSGS